MEKIAGVLDKSEADAIYVVGGDGTLSRVLSGMYKNTGRSDRLPLGIFPGGNSNGSLHRLIPSWFGRCYT
jgi:diacylglycerol kinase family enzyme